MGVRGQEQKNCDPNNPDDAQCGDYWDFVAFDPEHRLVLAVVPGARTAENAQAIVEEVKQRLGGTAPALMTSDELPAYATAIETTFSEPVSPPARRGPGRPRIVPERSLPEGLCYATVHKERENGRVVAVEQEQVFGTAEALDEALSESSASQSVNTSFVERHHGTDRSRNARKSRKTYQFSKDWEIHEAMTYFTMYSYNFCWEVRTLRVRGRRVAGSLGRQRWRRDCRITSGPSRNGSPSQPSSQPRTPPNFDPYQNAVPPFGDQLGRRWSSEGAATLAGAGPLVPSPSKFAAVGTHVDLDLLRVFGITSET